MQLPGEFSPFIEKSGFFAYWSGRLPPPYPLSGPTTKKPTFLCVSSLRFKRKKRDQNRPCTVPLTNASVLSAKSKFEVHIFNF